MSKRKNESGSAIIYVLVLSAALFILIAAVTRIMHSAHKGNRKEKAELLKKVETMNDSTSKKSR